MKNLSAIAVMAACTNLASPIFGADNGDGTYTNPMLFADFPDAEIIRVDDDFYYQSSSFHFAPGNPIMHSRDLVNWTPAGFSIPDYKILEDPRYDLDGHGNAYGNGSWAPSLRYHNGMFYSVCYVWDRRPENKTGVDGVFLVSRAKNVAGPWTMNAIHAKMYDPGLFFDADGRVYVFHGQNELQVTELDADLTKVVTPAKTIFEGRSYLEGTHAYKVNGKYYLYNTGGGKQQCLRSDNVYGPYEMKTVCDSELTYQGTQLHQGGLVQLRNGDWWAVIFQDRGKHGRIPFLLPVEWKDGWPITYPVLTHEKPAVEDKTVNEVGDWRSDDFGSKEIGLQWQWNHHPAANGWTLAEREGWLRLKPIRTVPALREAQNVLTQRVFAPGCNAQTELDFSHLKDGDVAGLGLFAQHCTYIAAIRQDGKTRLTAVRQMNQNGRYSTNELASVELEGDQPVFLRAEVPFLQYAIQYSYSTDGKSFHPLGGLLGIPYEFFTDWLAPRFCLFDYAQKEIGGYADFNGFQLECTTEQTGNLIRVGQTAHAQFCDAFEDMSKPAFTWVSDPDQPPNLYLKWPRTSRIGTGIHDAASWAEAFESRSRRWLCFNRVQFPASSTVQISVAASGKGRIVLREQTVDGKEIAFFNVDTPDMKHYQLSVSHDNQEKVVPVYVVLEPGQNSLLSFRSMTVSTP